MIYGSDHLFKTNMDTIRAAPPPSSTCLLFYHKLTAQGQNSMIGKVVPISMKTNKNPMDPIPLVQFIESMICLFGTYF